MVLSKANFLREGKKSHEDMFQSKIDDAKIYNDLIEITKSIVLPFLIQSQHLRRYGLENKKSKLW